MNVKIKIEENNPWELMGMPRFSVEVKQAKSRDMQIKNNFELLSKLIGDNDIVISLNSTLVNMSQHKFQPLMQQFIETIQELDLEYKSIKTPGRPTSSFLSFLLRNKEINGQEILAYVPNDAWSNFQNRLPYYGSRYFIAKNSPIDSSILEDMLKMTDDEKLEYFKIIVYNSIYLGRMGICSKYVSLSELEDLLKV